MHKRKVSAVAELLKTKVQAESRHFVFEFLPLREVLVITSYILGSIFIILLM